MNKPCNEFALVWLEHPLVDISFFSKKNANSAHYGTSLCRLSFKRSTVKGFSFSINMTLGQHFPPFLMYIDLKGKIFEDCFSWKVYYPKANNNVTFSSIFVYCISFSDLYLPFHQEQKQPTLNFFCSFLCKHNPVSRLSWKTRSCPKWSSELAYLKIDFKPGFSALALVH